MSLTNKNEKKIFVKNNKIISILNDKNSSDIKDEKEKSTKLKSMKNEAENDSNFLTSFFMGNIEYNNSEPNNKLNSDKDNTKIKIPAYISSKDILFSSKNNELDSSLYNNNSIKSFNEETENEKNKSFKQYLTNKKIEKKEEEVIDDISFMSNNSIMNFLSENAINLYLKKGNNMDIDDFFKDYIKNPKNKDIKQLQMIISSQEFQSKAQKYRKNIIDLNKSFLSNDNKFLNKKHNLSGKEINLNNNEKKFSFNKNNKNDLNLNKNNIKIKNNKIINEIKDKNVFNNDYIDYQSVFIKQFVKINKKGI